MRLLRTTTGLLAITFMALLSGCLAEQTEKDMLADAQFCLDKSTSATASACMSKINGLTSPESYALRCAEGFITAGITSPANLGGAMSAIKNNGGTVAMLSALSFPNTSAANNTFTSCNLSNQSGMALIGAMAKSATVLANAAGALASCSTPSGCDAALTAQMTALISDLNSGTPSAATIETVTAITGSVSVVYASTCSGTTTTNTDICSQINTSAAAAGVDPANMTQAESLALGAQLLGTWKTP